MDDGTRTIVNHTDGSQTLVEHNDGEQTFAEHVDARRSLKMAAGLRTPASPGRDRAQTDMETHARPDGIGSQHPAVRAGPRQIFLIARYRRVSGSALTATTPSASPAAARVIAVTYLSARIISS